MADNTKLIGQNYTTPDLEAKVTGKAKYAEDYRVEGMLFAKLLVSPHPHAKVRRLDTTAALAMPGVKAILTADDMPGAAVGATLGEGVQASAQAERGLTNEPLYQGEPILAVAAIDEKTAAEAIEAIDIEYEPLPFVVDPIESLRPNGPNARVQGNVWMRPTAPPAAPGARGAGNSAAGASAATGAQVPAAATAAGTAAAGGGRPTAPAEGGPAAPAGAARAGAGAPPAQGAAAPAGAAPAGAAPAAAGAAAGAAAARGGRGGRGAAAGAPAPPQITVWKWTDEDFAKAGPGQMPMGKATDEWVFGNVEEGFKKADLIVDETFMTQSTGHQPLETRTAMAYWQNGKLFLHGSTQSTVQTVASVARWTGLTPDKVVIISEYTGGGFGSKIPGAISMAIPALLSKKANAPVMMRITREDEHFIGRARPGILARVKLGLRKDGRITAIDMYAICDNGPYDAQGDGRSAGTTISLAYQPETMRWRGLTVLTNTPPKTSQRAPGGAQGIGLFEPILSKAAKKLGLDQVAVRRINAPAGHAPFGPALPNGKQAYVTSAFVTEALDKGRELFQWDAKKASYSGKKQGHLARGIGVAVSPYSGGSIGFDGLFIIKPDGRITFQSGIGNLGTHSMFDVHRQAAEMLGQPWEMCDVNFGNTAKNLPWTCISAGSQTAHAMTRAAHAAATDAIKKLQEIAAKAHGGNPDAYKVAGGKVSGPGGSMTFAQAAQKAIEYGGKFDGHELPEDINNFTKTSAKNLVGQGLMAVAKDAYPRDGQSQSFVVGFAEVEVDTETGVFKVIDYAAIADVGTVLNPRSLKGQLFGGSMLGLGHAKTQRWAYDQHYGVALARRFYQNKPPTILDAPLNFTGEAVGLPDPETPTGIRGVGEPPVGAAYGAIMNAIADALGDEIFRKAPVSLDIVLNALENGGQRTHEALTAHV
ncbi:MAG TPA: xanthine dehydrogenase family protein [Vicinamibacterales bacterium]|jgi:CO/xanthine dehydrogenase Mo-binding subunit|nr:xanthine dehydrogenase family protein [Vicinamibacterales bacterium]